MFILKTQLLLINTFTVLYLFNTIDCQFLAGGLKQINLTDLKSKNEMVNWAKFGVNEITKIRRKEYGNEALNFNLL